MKRIVSNIQGETIFITGGAGFIGSTLTGVLLDDNKVIVYDNFFRNSLIEKSFASHPNLIVCEGDILNIEDLKQAINGSSYVIHCAGIAGIDTVLESPVTTMRVNMLGSANVLEAAARETACKRIVCFSTSEVFGQMAFRAEETSPATLGAVGEARWIYAVSKLAEEHLSYGYYKELDLPTVTVRPFNIYGPGQVGEGALRTFVIRALKDENIVINGDGTQIRSWCYVDDMVRAVLLCMTKEAAIGESFNIGNQRDVITILGLANMIIRVLNSKSKVEFMPKLSADIELRIPHVGKARDVLGFEAEVDLEDGIRLTAEHYKELI
jgi:UDP-glucose 4-epimerase